MQLRTLGFNIGHDRAACVVEDGAIVSYIAEERLDRKKHSFGDNLPQLAIRYVLEQADCNLQQIDRVCISGIGFSESQLRHLVQNLGYPDPSKIDVIGHHLSHAYSAYFTSPFQKAAIWIADGGGDFVHDGKQQAESYYLADGMQLLHLYTRFQDNTMEDVQVGNVKVHPSSSHKLVSLGRKYEQITYLIGFGFGQAGKTMGLSSYGINGDKWRSQIEMTAKYEPKITLSEIILDFMNSNGDIHLNTSFQIYADLAAEVQSYLEDAAMACLQDLYQDTRVSNLCIAGGVGLNCVLNAKILSKSDFESVYTFPVAGDDGQAIGNALFSYYKAGGDQRVVLKSASQGRRYKQSEIQSLLSNSTLVNHYSEDIFFETASLISEGKIVAWFNGGSECGPRALGNRSILADPRREEMKDILNLKVKHRESFRPFAPAILEELASEYFDFPSTPSLYYMLVNGRAKPRVTSQIPSVIHVDQTSRLQLVNMDSAPSLYKLIRKFYMLTNIPMVLNTSFNIAGEPLVETPLDALNCFQSTDIDYLVLENFLISKR